MEGKIENRSDLTSDQDLVYLSGLHAYLNYRVDQTIEINDSTFFVEHTNYNNPNGLDALTVQNEESGEFTIVFVGTDVHSEFWN